MDKDKSEKLKEILNQTLTNEEINKKTKKRTREFIYKKN